MGQGLSHSSISAAILTIITILSGLAHAAPVGPSLSSRSLVSRNETLTYSNTTTPESSTTVATTSLPTTTSNRGAWDGAHGATTTLLPIITSLYHGKTGGVDFNVSTGATVLRDHTDSNAEISTLVTFQIDQAYADCTCELVLDLSYQRVSGTQRADIFTSSAPATTNTKEWPQGNMRDRQMGRVLASQMGGRAVWEQSYNGGSTFPCKNFAGGYLAAEVVAVGDDDFLTWKVGQYWSEGVKIVVS